MELDKLYDEVRWLHGSHRNVEEVLSAMTGLAVTAQEAIQRTVKELGKRQTWSGELAPRYAELQTYLQGASVRVSTWLSAAPELAEAPAEESEQVQVSPDSLRGGPWNRSPKKWRGRAKGKGWSPTPLQMRKWGRNQAFEIELRKKLESDGSNIIANVARRGGEALWIVTVDGGQGDQPWLQVVTVEVPLPPDVRPFSCSVDWLVREVRERVAAKRLEWSKRNVAIVAAVEPDPRAPHKVVPLFDTLKGELLQAARELIPDSVKVSTGDPDHTEVWNLARAILVKAGYVGEAGVLKHQNALREALNPYALCLTDLELREKEWIVSIELPTEHECTVKVPVEQVQGDPELLAKAVNKRVLHREVLQEIRDLRELEPTEKRPFLPDDTALEWACAVAEWAIEEELEVSVSALERGGVELGLAPKTGERTALLIIFNAEPNRAASSGALSPDQHISVTWNIGLDGVVGYYESFTDEFKRELRKWFSAPLLEVLAERAGAMP